MSSIVNFYETFTHNSANNPGIFSLLSVIGVPASPPSGINTVLQIDPTPPATSSLTFADIWLAIQNVDISTSLIIGVEHALIKITLRYDSVTNRSIAMIRSSDVPIYITHNIETTTNNKYVINFTRTIGIFRNVFRTVRIATHPVASSPTLSPP